jgi:photosystem II stability/assembly factor-like uncharacterized protein
MARTVVLLIGTKRGLFIARSDERRERWTLSAPLLAGREVYHAVIDPRDGRTAWAASRHTVWGAHVHRSDDAGATWQVLEAAPHHDDERGLEAVWCIAPGPPSRPNVLYAGIEPAGLFMSEDHGASWSGVESLNGHDTRPTWQPAGGALALHSIHGGDDGRILCAISAGGVYRSDDGGESFTPLNAGVRANFLPQRYPETGQCVHRLMVHPAMPARLYQQNHCGVYRSDDAGNGWTEITDGLPSDFGYVLALDARDPDSAYVVPEDSSHLRTVVDGRLRVYRTRDAGATWQPLSDGLPQENAWVSLLREAMAADTLDPLGIYFGTSSGHLFASRDGGDSWQLIAGYLPRILSVTAASGG